MDQQHTKPLGAFAVENIQQFLETFYDAKEIDLEQLSRGLSSYAFGVDPELVMGPVPNGSLISVASTPPAANTKGKAGKTKSRSGGESGSTVVSQVEALLLSGGHTVDQIVQQLGRKRNLIQSTIAQIGKKRHLQRTPVENHQGRGQPPMIYKIVDS